MSVFARLIFLHLNPVFLVVLSAAISALYIYKYTRFDFIEVRTKRMIYGVRALNWLTFAAALILVIFLPGLEARAILRLSIGFLMLSELAYNYDYLVLMSKDIKKLLVQGPRKLRDAVRK